MLLVKHKRKRQRRVSQHAIAAATGIAQPLISLIETGRLKPTAEQLRRLAAFYNVDPNDLLREVVEAEEATVR